MDGDSSVIRGKINASLGMKVILRCVFLNRRIHQEACDVILKLVRIVIHTGGANNAFRPWMGTYNVHDLVRELKFPLFHCFNPGQYSVLGHLYDQHS